MTLQWHPAMIASYLLLNDGESRGSTLVVVVVVIVFVIVNVLALWILTRGTSDE